MRARWPDILAVLAVWAAALWATLKIFPFPPWHLALIALAMAAQLLPVLEVRRLGRPIPPARLWIAIWSLVFFISDIGQIFVAQATGDNLWFFAVMNPIEDAALLMAYSYWQRSPVMRLTFRMAMPLLVAATLAIALSLDEINNFKSVSSPFRLLFLTIAVAYTLVSRATAETGSIWRRDWLWTSFGVILYTAAYVVVDPVSAALYPTRPDLARFVYVVKAGLDTVAYLLVWKGMRCATEQPSPSILPLS